MSKSGGGFLTVQRLINEGFDPLAYRYLCLTAHYRSELAFNVETWDSLHAATKALGKIYELRAQDRRETTGLSDQDYQAAKSDGLRRHLRRPEPAPCRGRLARSEVIPVVARV